MIYITGDMHADKKRFNEKGMKKLKKNDFLIVCGDFGFVWNGSKEEQKALHYLSKKKFNILFVDGKHENFDILNGYEEKVWKNGKVHQIEENIYHLMRGQIFEIENKKIFTFGGGESPDKDIRISAGTWWPQEMPQISEMKESVSILNKSNRKVDYIITHEPPLHIKKLIYKTLNYINPLESFFDDLSKNIEYKKWFFGCLHINRKIASKHYAVFNNIINVKNF